MSEILIRDSRTLAFSIYGDPYGKPVFFFHGTPGSRLFRPPDEITSRVGVKLICVDRPGYGKSTFQTGRRILDWPEDIVQIADKLGLDTFAVAGHSGGGPYALACAHRLSDRISIAATLAGAGPVGAINATNGITFLNKLGFKYGRYLPWIVSRTLTWLLYHERCADPAKAMSRETGHRPLADEGLINQPEIRDLCIQSEIEAFRPGLTGMSWDVHLITHSWGFNLEEIKVPVRIWHGTADNVTSVFMAKYMANIIPASRIQICEGEGHLFLIPHWEEIIRQLISE